MNVFNQERFQGKKRRYPYFEGYYFRMVAKSGRSVAVIPGISLTEGDTHSFVQIIDSNGSSGYFRFTARQFEYSNNGFFISVGKNSFSSGGLSLDIDTNPVISGTVRFKNNIPYPKSVKTPNIMGPFSYLPFLECRHGIVSMRSDLEGELELNGEKIDLNGGVGYIEKDWGSSFPSKYIWAQSNCFAGHDASFMISVARVPIMGMAIRGLIAFLYCDGRFSSFSTYDGATVKSITRRGENLEIIIKAPSSALYVFLKPQTCAKLKAPVYGAMNREIRESGSGEIKLELFDARGNSFHGIGENAAMEFCAGRI